MELKYYNCPYDGLNWEEILGDRELTLRLMKEHPDDTFLSLIAFKRYPNDSDMKPLFNKLEEKTLDGDNLKNNKIFDNER